MTAEASCLLFKWKVYIFNTFTRAKLLAFLELCQSSSHDIGKAGLYVFKGNFQMVLCGVLVAMLNPGKTTPSGRDTHCQQSLLSEIYWNIPIFSLSFITRFNCHYSFTQSSTRISLHQSLPKIWRWKKITACLKNSQNSSNPKKYVLTLCQIHQWQQVSRFDSH